MKLKNSYNPQDVAEMLFAQKDFLDAEAGYISAASYSSDRSEIIEARDRRAKAKRIYERKIPKEIRGIVSGIEKALAEAQVS